MTILSAYNADQNMKPIADDMARLKNIWTNYSIESGKKIPIEKSAEIADLAESVRINMVK